MRNPEVTVICTYTDEGEGPAQIILHSFELYLKKVLTGQSSSSASLKTHD
ncbi:MAG: hypothetical protein VB064_12210 [Oscillospiraceae bacterium]|nr:hypothetical protein [Oscillospiraceae bacterium]